MCGIVWVYDTDWSHENDDLVSKCFSLLQSNENRGQDSYGMSIIFNDGEVIVETDGWLKWLSNKVWKYKSHTSKKIRAVLWQARYTTSWLNDKASAQPREIIVDGISYVLLFNGNISNAEALAEKFNFTQKYSLPKPLLDTQVVECLIKEFVSAKRGDCSLEEITNYINSEMKWAFTAALASSKKDLAISVDKNGVRRLPFSYSADKGLLVFSSEQEPIDDVSKRIKLSQEILEWWNIASINFSENWRPVFSKTIMKVQDDIRSYLCLLEFLYLMRSDSQESFKLRKIVWKALYEENSEQFDSQTTICMHAPHSWYYAAEWYAEAAWINFNPDILKKHSKKRTFIVQIDGRDEEINTAYYIDKEALEEFAWENPDLESVVLVDDSVVNGGTMRYLPSMLKEAFREIYNRDIDVHIRIPMSPIAADCENGMVLNRDKLVIVENCNDPYNPTEDELDYIARSVFKTESLKYLSKEKLKSLALDWLNQETVCMACIDWFDHINHEKIWRDGERTQLKEAA